MNTRAKFRCYSVTTYQSGPKNVKFTAIYDESIPEDRRFMKATPSGSFEMLVDPSVADLFVIGKSYYLDLTEAQDAPR